jgi:signal transduction histidine kinase
VRVLVVDDDDLVRRALAAELQREHTVTAVDGGTAAFAAMARGEFDVVISDLSMPDHDGLEVLAIARQLNPGAVRILLTGYLDDHAQRALRGADAPLHVSKPWHGALEEAIAQGLAARAAGGAPVAMNAPVPHATTPPPLAGLTAMLDRRDRRATPTDAVVPSDARRGELLREATLGAMTSSLMHDLAAMVQVIDASLAEVAPVVLDLGDPALVAAVADARGAGREAVALFNTMRRFIRAGELTYTRTRLVELVGRATRIAGGYVRARATLCVADVPDVELEVCEPLVLQVLVNLLRNAANASPPGGVVDLVVVELDGWIEVRVIDDGPGVAPELVDEMFEPLATTAVDGTGLGLTISAFVTELHGGSIRYQRAVLRGACFRVTLPRQRPRPA